MEEPLSPRDIYSPHLEENDDSVGNKSPDVPSTSNKTFSLNSLLNYLWIHLIERFSSAWIAGLFLTLAFALFASSVTFGLAVPGGFLMTGILATSWVVYTLAAFSATLLANLIINSLKISIGEDKTIDDVQLLLPLASESENNNPQIDHAEEKAIPNTSLVQKVIFGVLTVLGIEGVGISFIVSSNVLSTLLFSLGLLLTVVAGFVFLIKIRKQTSANEADIDELVQVRRTMAVEDNEDGIIPPEVKGCFMRHQQDIEEEMIRFLREEKGKKIEEDDINDAIRNHLITTADAKEAERYIDDAIKKGSIILAVGLTRNKKRREEKRRDDSDIPLLPAGENDDGLPRVSSFGISEDDDAHFPRVTSFISENGEILSTREYRKSIFRGFLRSFILFTGCAIMLGFIFTTGITLPGGANNMIWSTLVATSLAVLGWWNTRHTFKKISAGPYIKLATLISLALIVFITLLGFYLTGAPLMLSLTTLVSVICGLILLLTASGIIAHENTPVVSQKIERYGKRLLQILKIMAGVGFMFLAFLSMAMMLQLKNLGPFSGMLNFAFGIADILSNGNIEMAIHWMSVVGIAVFAISGFAGFELLKSSLKVSHSNRDEFSKYKTFITLIAISLKYIFAIGIIVLLTAMPSALEAGANTSMLLPFLVLISILPLFGSNTQLPESFGSLRNWLNILGTTPILDRGKLLLREFIVGCILFAICIGPYYAAGKGLIPFVTLLTGIVTTMIFREVTIWRNINNKADERPDIHNHDDDDIDLQNLMFHNGVSDVYYELSSPLHQERKNNSSQRANSDVSQKPAGSASPSRTSIRTDENGLPHGHSFHKPRNKASSGVGSTDLHQPLLTDKDPLPSSNSLCWPCS